MEAKKRRTFKTSYSIFKTLDGKYKISFSGDAENPPPSYAYWQGEGKFLQTAKFSTPGMAQLFRHNHLHVTDKTALGIRAYADSGVFEYGSVTEYPLEP